MNTEDKIRNMELKMGVGEQIVKIFALQRTVEQYHEKIEAMLKESDELTSELQRRYGNDFVSDDRVLSVVYRAIGHGIAGNMNWLEVNNRIRVIKSVE